MYLCYYDSFSLKERMYFLFCRHITQAIKVITFILMVQFHGKNNTIVNEVTSIVNNMTTSCETKTKLDFNFFLKLK